MHGPAAKRGTDRQDNGTRIVVTKRHRSFYKILRVNL
jgi:hypothetical protein